MYYVCECVISIIFSSLSFTYNLLTVIWLVCLPVKISLQKIDSKKIAFSLFFFVLFFSFATKLQFKYGYSNPKPLFSASSRF